MAGILVGYCRTSSAEQQAGLEAQERDLKGAGVEKLFSEQVSSVARREQLEAAIDFSRAGDTLIVTRPDRLSRGVADLLHIIEKLEKKGVALRILGRVDKPDPASDCCELHEPEEAGRELVVAGRHAA